MPPKKDDKKDKPVVDMAPQQPVQDRVIATNLPEAQAKLGSQKVVSVGGGKFTTPEALAAKSSGGKYFISGPQGGREVTKEEYDQEVRGTGQPNDPAQQRLLEQFKADVLAAEGTLPTSEEQARFLQEQQNPFEGQSQQSSLGGAVIEGLGKLGVNSYLGLTGTALEFTAQEEGEIDSMSEYFNIPKQEVAMSTLQRKTENLFQFALEKSTRLFGDVQFFGLSVDNTLDTLTNRKDADALQSGLGKVGTIASTIKGTRDAGGISTAEAVAQLKSLDVDLSIMEANLKQAMILEPTLVTSGKVSDIEADILDQRTSIREAVADVLSTEQRFDPASIIALTDEFEKVSNVRRERLI